MPNEREDLYAAVQATCSTALRNQLDRRIRALSVLLRATISADTFPAEMEDVLASTTPTGKTRFLGFNGQFVRASVFIYLLRHLPFDCFIETGTFQGSTALLVAAQTSLNVFSCDLDPDRITCAEEFLAPLCSRIHLFNLDSRVFLDAILARPDTALPFCYLDAHWNDDLPLRGELERILSRRIDYLIAIDDFRVPHDGAFGFDSYPNAVLDCEYIRPVVEKHAPDSRIWYPAYASELETGARRGFLVIASPKISTAIEAAIPRRLLTMERPDADIS